MARLCLEFVKEVTRENTMSARQPLPLYRWHADSEHDDCELCSSVFWCMLRRHHCRFCGKVLCYLCSAAEIDGQRSCDPCATTGSINTLTMSPSVLSARNMTKSPLMQHKMNRVRELYGSPSMDGCEHKSKQRSRASSLSRPNAPPSPMLSRSLAHSPTLNKFAMPSLPPLSMGATANSKGPSSPTVIVVDPLSTGAVVAAELISRGFQVLRVFSAVFPDHIMNLTLDGLIVSYVATVQHLGTPQKTIALIKKEKLNIVGLIAGCETGVELGDVIAEALNLQGNGTRLSETRRNKYKMGERVRACGVRGVRQFIAYSLKDIRSEMAKSYDLSQPFTVVIKPCASAGSDGVYKCTSMSELEMYFQEIVGETNMLGNVNSSVVVQEYLEGKEYVCDSVSVDGHVKFVTVWEYDKRTANGKNFIYFGMRMMSGEGKIERQLMAYMRGVLKALDIKNGPAHAEVIMTPTGPCLVEVGSRCHGGEGSWVSMVNAALGYSQVKVTVDACINQKAFALIPDTPSQPKMFGVEFFFVSRQEGTLKAMPRLHEIEQLPSFLKADMMIKEGDKIVKTVDCITRPGSVRLLHSSKAQVEKDYEVLRQMEQDGFFIVE